MPIVGNSYIPENDITGRRRDGRGYLIWPANKPMPLTEAYRLGIIKPPNAHLLTEHKDVEKQHETEAAIFAGSPVVDVAPDYNATDGAIALAKEYKVDLASIEGTGSNGRITKGDVAKFVDESIEV